MKPEFITTGHTNGSMSHPVYSAIMEHVECGPDMALVPTRPLYDGPKRWVLFIEDWVTLYNPDILNGKTSGIDLHAHPRTTWLRQKFADPRFIGIACHHRGTFQDLCHLELTDKLFYFPYGLVPRTRNAIRDGPTVSFTFINSWNAGDGNFYPRGGEIVCRAFKSLWDSGERRAFLDVAAMIPDNSASREFMLHCPNVRVANRHISDSEFDELMTRTDCLLLPSHRVHVNSLLRPLSHGIPVISSDGWGNEEYVIDGWNGFRVRGVFGRTTWHNQVMQEDYSRWPDTLAAVPVVASLMRRLIEERELLRRLGANAHAYVNEVHTIERMKSALEKIFRG